MPPGPVEQPIALATLVVADHALQSRDHAGMPLRDLQLPLRSWQRGAAAASRLASGSLVRTVEAGDARALRRYDERE